MSIDMKQLLADIKANSHTLDSCPRHEINPDEYTPGKKLTCIHCGGQMDPVQVAWYVKGYEAHGGKCDDIWPGFRTPKKKQAGAVD